MKLRLMPPGKNELGTSGLAESAQPFFVGATEVTVAQFRRFVEETKFKTAAETSTQGGMRVQPGKKTERDPENLWTHPDFARGDEHPVTVVTWHDAMAFCAWLGRKEGRTYRLPTSAEWRWAERAGSATRFYFAGDVSTMDDHAWHNGNSKVHSHPVAGKQPNPWGLFDMYGNAWELSYDWQRAGRPVDPLLDKAGPTTTDRMLFLGGAFTAPPDSMLEQPSGPAHIGYSHLGFRVALVGALQARPTLEAGK
jgi:formylglycine-generating enzyme required for sulfatase activity